MADFQAEALIQIEGPEYFSNLLFGLAPFKPHRFRVFHLPLNFHPTAVRVSGGLTLPPTLDQAGKFQLHPRLGWSGLPGRG
jgi:hypothetical protein